MGVRGEVVDVGEVIGTGRALGCREKEARNGFFGVGECWDWVGTRFGTGTERRKVGRTWFKNMAFLEGQAKDNSMDCIFETPYMCQFVL
jgi:hypothetical protein